MNETRERVVLGCDASPCNYCNGTSIHLNWLFNGVYSQFLSTNSVLGVSKLGILLRQPKALEAFRRRLCLQHLPTNLTLDFRRNHGCKELASNLISNMLRLMP